MLNIIHPKLESRPASFTSPASWRAAAAHRPFPPHTERERSAEADIGRQKEGEKGARARSRDLQVQHSSPSERSAACMIHSNWGTVAAEPCRRVPKAQVMSNRRPGCESRTAFPPFPRAERDERRGAGGGGVCGKGCGIAEAINRLTLLIPPRWLSGFPPNSRESLRGETHSQRKPDRLGEEERRPGWRRSAFRRRRHGRGKGSGAAGQSNVSHSCARCIRLHFPLGEVPPDATCA